MTGMARDRRTHPTEPDYRGGPLENLTPRETEVLALVATGLSNKQIARALLITPHTTRAHVSRILHKLGVESRTEAAVLWTKRIYEL